METTQRHQKSKLLIIGLAAGDWLVKQGNDQQKLTVTAEAGMLYVEVSSNPVIIKVIN